MRSLPIGLPGLALAIALGLGSRAGADPGGEERFRRLLEAMLSRPRLSMELSLRVREPAGVTGEVPGAVAIGVRLDLDRSDPDPRRARLALHTRFPILGRMPDGAVAAAGSVVPATVALHGGKVFLHVDDRLLTGEAEPLTRFLDLRAELGRLPRRAGAGADPARLAELYLLRSRSHGARFSEIPGGVRVQEGGKPDQAASVEIELGTDTLPRRLVASRPGGRRLEVVFERIGALVGEVGPLGDPRLYRPLDMTGVLRLGAVLVAPEQASQAGGGEETSAGPARSPFASPSRGDDPARAATPPRPAGDPFVDVVEWLVPVADRWLRGRAPGGRRP